MKLNLDKQLIGIRGEPLSDKLNEVLADVLAISNTGSPARMIAWAVNLINDGEIEVSRTDLDFLYGLIETSPNIINLAKARLIEEIIKAKEEKQSE